MTMEPQASTMNDHPQQQQTPSKRRVSSRIRQSSKQSEKPATAKKTPKRRQQQQQTPVVLPVQVVVEEGSPAKKPTLLQNDGGGGASSTCSSITADAINATVLELFGEADDDSSDDVVLQRPCVKARLFACFVLAQKLRSSSDDAEKTNLQKHLEPILPFLKALVHVEVVSLGPSATEADAEENLQQQQQESSSSSSPSSETVFTGVNAAYATVQFVLRHQHSASFVEHQQQQQQQQSAAAAAEEQQKKPTKKKKKPHRVQFSGFDCSSAQPPIDREIGLLPIAQHQPESIQALMDCLDELTKLSRAAAPSLELVLDFLAEIASKKRGGCLLAEQCALSIQKHYGKHYAPERVCKVAATYHNEFTILIRRLLQLPPPPPSNNPGTPLQNQQAMMNSSSSSSSFSNAKKLLVEKKLAEQVGQAMRYIFRTYLNRAPPRLSAVNEQYDEYAEKAFSKVGDCFRMVMDDNDDEEDMDDAFLSALFSKALLRVYEYYGLDTLLDASATEPNIPDQFCASEPSQRHLPIRTRKGEKPVPTSDQDVELVKRDIAEATAFLAATKAARFLLDILTAPGVQDEIAVMGGWGELEHFASVSWKYDLWRICPDDAHLVVLCNYNAFVQRLDDYCSVMEQSVAACEAALECTKRNYHLTSKTLHTKFPEITILSAVYNDGMELASQFPLVLEPNQEAEAE